MIFQNKIIIEECYDFTFLPISLNYGLIEDYYILISTTAFNLLHYIVFTEVYDKNPPSNRYSAVKGGPHTLPEKVSGAPMFFRL